MKGTIAAFRGTRRRKSTNQMIILVEGVDSKEKAKGLVGKKVVWTAPGKQKKQLSGRVSAVHGSKGAVRAIFDKGMPGQSLGTNVVIVE